MSKLVLWNLLVVALAASGACGGGTGVTSQPPAVTVTEPAENLEIGLGRGGTVGIRYVDADPDDEAVTDIFADRDGDLGTTHDQVLIAEGRPELDGDVQTVSWNVQGAAPGTYRIVARTSDAFSSAKAEAPGYATLNAPPTLAITEPASDMTVSRGVTVPITYVDDDPDDTAITVLFADQDGDPGTTQDSHDITRWLPEHDGAPQDGRAWDTSAVTPGAYQILGQTWDGTNPPSTAMAPGKITVRNVAYAKRAGGTNSDTAWGVATFPDGSCVVVGEFQGTATFGTGSGAIHLISAGGMDIFVVRYDADGVPIWARSAGGTGSDEGWGVATFPDGSCVTTGYFKGTAEFGEKVGEDSLIATGSKDVFIARYDAYGTLTWARRAGGEGEAQGWGIAASADGSCVITGYFTGDATFRTGDVVETLESAGAYDLFVARYGVDGTLAWAKRAGGPGSDRGYGIAAFADGSCAVTGDFVGTATFEEGATPLTLESAGSGDIFVARYDATGTLTWATKAGGTNDDWGWAIAAYPDGSCAATGNFAGAAVFGEDLDSEILTSEGSVDMFVARYNLDGTLAWAKGAGGSDWEDGGGICAHADGSCVVTGDFEGMATFGEGERAHLLTSSGDYDVFVARFDPDGTLAWVRQAGGDGWASSWGCASTLDGSTVVVGDFRGTAIFGKGAGEVIVASDGSTDLFVARYNPDGGF